MNIFDSKRNKKWAGAGINISDSHIIFSQSGFSEINIGPIKYNSVLKIIGKKRSGSGTIGVKILAKDKTIIIDKIINFTKSSWAEVSFDIISDLDSSGPCALRLYRPLGSFGRVEIARLLISSEVPDRFLDLNENNNTEDIDDDKLRYILDHYFNFSTKIAIIVPYSIYGGAEIYIKNIISNIDFKFIKFDIIYMQDNNLAREINSKCVSHSISRSLDSLRAKLVSCNYDAIIYYNSLKIYYLLESMIDTGEISSKVVEIYHSDFKWQDSVSNLNRRNSIHKILRVSDSLLNNLDGIDKTCIRTVPVGIDIGRFRRKEVNELRMSLGIQKNTHVLGTIARLSPEKNLFYFLEIAKNMKDYFFIVVGEGPEDKKLKIYCAKNNILNVKFLGHKKDVENYYSIMDAFILTSKIEGTPISILEAMANECLVFSTPVGGIPSILRNNETGYFLSGDVTKDINIIKENFKDSSIISNAKKYVVNNHNILKTSRMFLEEIIFEPKFYSKIDIDNNSIILNGSYV